MPTPDRLHYRLNRGKRQPNLSIEATTLETLTVENVLYEIKLIGDQNWVLGQRKGYSWYTEDDAPLAEAAQVVAIRIPARRH